jgi:L-asparaginase II
MVAGPGRVDTRIMQCMPGAIVSKAGAEAFQAVNILPGKLSKNSPAIGIAIKIADGDHRKQARRAVLVEVLKQLNLLTPNNIKDLSEYGPELPVYNQRRILTGWGKPCFQLQYS